MALNCIVISGDGRIPSRIQSFLPNARFLDVLDTVSDLGQARKRAQNVRVHYLLMEQETAHLHFNELLGRQAKDDPQVIIFGEEKMFFLDGFQGSIPDSSLTELDSRETSAGSVDINLNEGTSAGLLDETNPDVPVKVIVKAARARLISRSNVRGAASIFVRSESRISRIRLDELLYVEAQKDYVVFHTTKNSFRTLNSMKNIQAHLDDEEFFRIHRSYIVRLDKIHTIHSDEVLLDDARIPVPIGPSFKSKLMKRLDML
jgi:hypothetical protein